MNDTEHTDLITCPYCGHVDQSSWEFLDGEDGCAETECGECGQEILVTRHIRITYSAEKVQP